MIRVLFLLLISFFSLTAEAQLWKYAGRGMRMDEMRIDSTLNIPSDTVRNKSGIARIGSNIYIGNGVFWSGVTGAGGIDSVTVTSVAYIDSVFFWAADTVNKVVVIKKRNGLVFGCGVTAINDTTYAISPANYVIGGLEYNSIADTIVTNSNTDSTGRYLVLGVDNTGFAFGVPGANAANPQVPALTTDQVGCATIYYPPLSASPVINNYTSNVYNVGADSSAFVLFTRIDDTTGIFCDRSGRCDTLKLSIDPTLATKQALADSIQQVRSEIPAQFNPVAGTNISLSGSYPNITINSTAGGGSAWATNINTFTHNNRFIRLFAGVFRATCPGASQPITWAFLDSTTTHNYTCGFDSIDGVGNDIRIFYQKVKNVISMNFTTDETLALAGVQLGGSVGDSSANVRAYILRGGGGRLTGNGSSWTVTSLNSGGVTYNTSTGLTTFSPTTSGLGTIYAGSPEIESTIITYVGDSNKRVRRVYSGLGGATVGFYLVDSTNKIVTGNLVSGDRVNISIPRPMTVAMPAQTANSTGFPCDIYTASANIWVNGVMELYMVGYAPDSTTVKLEWQTAKTGSANYATNYRITRATVADPNTETEIFNGYGFTVTDSGLTTGTRYLYRMYATILATERLITTEKVRPVAPLQ